MVVKRIFFMVLLLTGILFGQQSYKVVQVGGGVGLVGVDGSVTLPPVTLMFDYITEQNLSFGFVGGRASTKWTNTIQLLNYSTFEYENYEYGYEYGYTFFAARGGYHFVNNEKIDVYAGLLLGYVVVSASAILPENIPENLVPSASTNYMLYGGFGGIRLFLSPNFGLYAEGGYGVSLANGGIVIRF